MPISKAIGQETRVIRWILSFFGAIFSLVTLGLIFMAIAIGAVFWIYGRDLPSYDQLAQYSPADHQPYLFC